MRTRTILTTTALLFPAGLAVFAGGPAACAAQTEADSQRERLLLSAAIEEVRRSPFHAGATADATWKVQAIVLGTDMTASFPLSQPEPEGEHPMDGYSFATTIVLAELSHLAAAYLFWGCGFGALPGAACFLGPILPLPVVALPAMASGVAPGKALGASGIGLLGGAAAYLLTGYITEQLSNIRVFSSALVSGLVHAVITPVLVRPR